MIAINFCLFTSSSYLFAFLSRWLSCRLALTFFFKAMISDSSRVFHILAFYLLLFSNFSQLFSIYLFLRNFNFSAWSSIWSSSRGGIISYNFSSSFFASSLLKLFSDNVLSITDSYFLNFFLFSSLVGDLDIFLTLSFIGLVDLDLSSYYFIYFSSLFGENSSSKVYFSL